MTGHMPVKTSDCSSAMYTLGNHWIRNLSNNLSVPISLHWHWWEEIEINAANNNNEKHCHQSEDDSSPPFCEMCGAFQFQLWFFPQITLEQTRCLDFSSLMPGKSALKSKSLAQLQNEKSDKWNSWFEAKFIQAPPDFRWTWNMLDCEQRRITSSDLVCTSFISLISGADETLAQLNTSFPAQKSRCCVRVSLSRTWC